MLGIGLRALHRPSHVVFVLRFPSFFPSLPRSGLSFPSSGTPYGFSVHGPHGERGTRPLLAPDLVTILTTASLSDGTGPIFLQPRRPRSWHQRSQGIFPRDWTGPMVLPLSLGLPRTLRVAPLLSGIPGTATPNLAVHAHGSEPIGPHTLLQQGHAPVQCSPRTSGPPR